ncbi:MAG: ABC transporter ATP-binding protein [Pseudomonadota bacterium]
MVSLFSVESVNLHYGREQVIHEVSLPDVDEGQLIGLIGPNAAGKSTLMKAMSGQITGSGNIHLNGKNFSEWGHDNWIKQVSYMPQTPPQPTPLLPWELLWSAARSLSLKDSDDELTYRITRLFSRLGLLPYANSPLYSLSGGKRQLVSLALTLIREPILLLLDEPTSALDLHWRLVVLDYVRERVKTTGGAAIAALHDLELAVRYCDRLVLLHQGKVAATGSAREVLTAANLASVYQVDAEIIETPSGFPMVQIHKPIQSTSA